MFDVHFVKLQEADIYGVLVHFYFELLTFFLTGHTYRLVLIIETKSANTILFLPFLVEDSFYRVGTSRFII